MRLTYRDITVPHTNAKGELWEAYSDWNYNEVINKLAAYEDTGFEPDEIDFCLSGAISPQEAKERYEAHKKRYDEWLAWKQAEEQGRLVILPCKVGDTVYWCPYLNDRTWVLSAEVTEVYVGRGGQIRLSLPDLDIEPIVPNAHLFFTREEAEVALKGEREDV